MIGICCDSCDNCEELEVEERKESLEEKPKKYSVMRCDTTRHEVYLKDGWSIELYKQCPINKEPTVEELREDLIPPEIVPVRCDGNEDNLFSFLSGR